VHSNGERKLKDSVHQQLNCLFDVFSHRVMRINVCIHHTHISSFCRVPLSSQECWQTPSHVNSTTLQEPQ